MSGYFVERDMDQGNDINCNETKMSTDCQSFMINVQCVDTLTVNNMYNIVADMSLSVGQAIRH